MIRKSIRVFGQVQGVGFRWKLMNIANRHNLTGYVRNLDNGNVEVEVQGSDVDQFIKEYKEGNHNSNDDGCFLSSKIACILHCEQI